jgi:hypothetical protein
MSAQGDGPFRGLVRGGEKKKKNTGSNGRRERRVSSGLRRAVEAVERKCMFPRLERSELARRHFVWSDVETYDAKFDGSINGSVDGSMEKKKRTVDSDDV